VLYRACVAWRLPLTPLARAPWLHQPPSSRTTGRVSALCKALSRCSGGQPREVLCLWINGRVQGSGELRSLRLATLIVLGVSASAGYCAEVAYWARESSLSSPRRTLPLDSAPSPMPMLCETTKIAPAALRGGCSGKSVLVLEKNGL
jgi:hypothetical protein